MVEGVLLNPRTLKIYESTKFIFFLNCLNWERHNLGDRTRTPRHLSRCLLSGPRFLGPQLLSK